MGLFALDLDYVPDFDKAAQPLLAFLGHHPAQPLRKKKWKLSRECIANRAACVLPPLSSYLAFANNSFRVSRSFNMFPRSLLERNAGTMPPLQNSAACERVGATTTALRVSIVFTCGRNGPVNAFSPDSTGTHNAICRCQPTVYPHAQGSYIYPETQQTQKAADSPSSYHATHASPQTDTNWHSVRMRMLSCAPSSSRSLCLDLGRGTHRNEKCMF